MPAYRMAGLLAKFRITYSDLTVIKDVKQAPNVSTRTWFDDLIRDFNGRDQLSGIRASYLSIHPMFDPFFLSNRTDCYACQNGSSFKVEGAVDRTFLRIQFDSNVRER